MLGWERSIAMIFELRVALRCGFLPLRTDDFGASCVGAMGRNRRQEILEWEGILFGWRMGCVR